MEQRRSLKVEAADELLSTFATVDEGRGVFYYDLPVVRPDRVQPRISV